MVLTLTWNSICIVIVPVQVNQSRFEHSQKQPFWKFPVSAWAIPRLNNWAFPTPYCGIGPIMVQLPLAYTPKH